MNIKSVSPVHPSITYTGVHSPRDPASSVTLHKLCDPVQALWPRVGDGEGDDDDDEEPAPTHIGWLMLSIDYTIFLIALTLLRASTKVVYLSTATVVYTLPVREMWMRGKRIGMDLSKGRCW